MRNTMHARINHSEVGTKFGYQQAFKKVGDLYDLDQWNDDYWNRLDTFLTETKKRDIIVQLELWDAYKSPEAMPGTYNHGILITM